MNFHMNKFQSYDNFEVVYVDDHSTDGSDEYLDSVIGHDPRFHLKQSNHPQGGQGNAFLNGIDYINPNDEDVIVEVDGDDWLSSVFVLQYLNEVYQNTNVWMTHGQYQIYPTGTTGGHYNAAHDRPFDRTKHALPFSHLKTYKSWLLNKVNRSDLIDDTTGLAYRYAWDHVLCIPMVEMATPRHIYRCDDILYTLNRSSELQNEGKVNTSKQKGIESLIRQKTPYNPL